MGTTVVTPPASAPAPATPAPATPAPATPTPTPTPAPATPSAPKSMEERLSQGWEKAKASVPLETPAEEPAAEPAPATEPAAEEVATEEEPAPEAEPAAEPAAPAEDEFKINLDDTGEPGTPQAFADAIKADPGTEKFFNEHPELKNQVFGALRRDAENREIRSYIPDVATAKTVTGYASVFQRMDRAFLAAEDPKNASAFITEWAKEAMMVGADGKPQVDGNGKYVMHPSFNNILETIFNNKLSVLKERAKTSGDERLQTALDILSEAIAPSSPGAGEVPEELKPYADGLKAKEKTLSEREETLNRQQRESAITQRHQAIERAESTVATSVTNQLQAAFKKAGLTQFEQDAAFAKVGRAVTEALGEIGTDGNWTHGAHPSAPIFQSEYDRLAGLLPNDQAETQLKKLVHTYTNEILGPIVARVTREAKGGSISRQTSKQTRVDAQRQASGKEPQGTSVAAPGAGPQLTPKQLREKVIADFREKNGRDPDMNEIHHAMFSQVSKQVGAR